MEPIHTDRRQLLETGEIPCTNCGDIIELDTMKVSDQDSKRNQLRAQCRSHLPVRFRNLPAPLTFKVRKELMKIFEV